MSETIAPTCEELDDGDGFERVHHETDATWRHGSYVTDVFHRKADDTYWMAAYRLSTDGETNELRDGEAEISRVKPVQKTVTDYVGWTP